MNSITGIYRSKQGLVSYIPVLILAVVIAIDVYTGSYWNGVFIILIMAIVVLPMLLNTRYIIAGNGTLNVRCGWFVNITMDINNIRKLEDTRSLLSSPALSLDRIEIFYNKFDSVMVSPEDKAGFVAALKNIKPSIEYQVNKKD